MMCWRSARDVLSIDYDFAMFCQCISDVGRLINVFWQCVGDVLGMRRRYIGDVLTIIRRFSGDHYLV